MAAWLNLISLLYVYMFQPMIIPFHAIEASYECVHVSTYDNFTGILISLRVS